MDRNNSAVTATLNEEEYVIESIQRVFNHANIDDNTSHWTLNLRDGGIIHTGDAIRKLAEYEDLEEQQKLLKLPFAVGDTVWYWDKDRDPLEEAPFEGCIYGYEIDSSNSVLIIIKPKITFIPAWNSVIRQLVY